MKDLKKLAITILGFLPLFLVLYSITFDPKLFMGGDNVNYFILGKSISLGEGYTNIHLAGNPIGNHFPPGYPFILSVFMRIFGYSVVTMKIINGVFLFFSVIISYLVTKQISGSKHMAIVTTILILFNAHYLYYGSIMMSEIPFSFFSLLSIFLLLKIDLEKKLWTNWYFWGLILVLVLTIYIRTSGVALLGAIVFYFLIKKKFMHGAITFATVALLLLPWQIRSHNAGGASYTNQLLSKNPYNKAEGPAGITDIFDRIGDNIMRYMSKEIPNAIFPSYKVEYADADGVTHNGDLVSWILGCTILLLIILGVFRKENRKIHIMIGSIIAFNLFILFVWPQIWYGIRFIMPLIPLLLYLMIRGLKTIFE